MSGYSQLKVDVREVPVPEKWRTFPFEYRHGFGKGLERDGVYNPVSHSGIDGSIRRSAWFAGYSAGKAERASKAVR